MITINGKTEKDYNANYIHWECSAPTPKIETASVPLRDGVINLTAMLSDEVFYEARTITIGLELRGLRMDWPAYYSAILRDFHGKDVEVQRSEDPNWFWIGWASVGPLEDHGASAGVTITVTAQPYKRSDQYIEVVTLTLSGDSTYTIKNPYMRGYPVFTASAADMTVTYEGETWTLPQGESEAYGLYFRNGNNALALHGSGTLTIAWRGGLL